VSDSERANEVRSALARSEDNIIVWSATIQQLYGRSIFMIRAKPNHFKEGPSFSKKYSAVDPKGQPFPKQAH
jgi:hypothetical protein